MLLNLDSIEKTKYVNPVTVNIKNSNVDSILINKCVVDYASC